MKREKKSTYIGVILIGVGLILMGVTNTLESVGISIFQCAAGAGILYLVIKKLILLKREEENGAPVLPEQTAPTASEPDPSEPQSEEKQ